MLHQNNTHGDETHQNDTICCSVVTAQIMFVLLSFCCVILLCHSAVSFCCVILLCHSAMCHFAVCHSAMCHSAMCHSAACHSAACHFAACHSAICHSEESHRISVECIDYESDSNAQKSVGETKF
jgi:hypothetical protein